MQAPSFSPMSEFPGSSIEAKCKPVKKYKRAPEKSTSEPVKSPYGGIVASGDYISAAQL